MIKNLGGKCGKPMPHFQGGDEPGEGVREGGGSPDAETVCEWGGGCKEESFLQEESKNRGN